MKKGCQLLEEMVCESICSGWEPVSQWSGEEHMKMANVMLFLENIFLPVSDLQLKYMVPLVFNSSALLPFP